MHCTLLVPGLLQLSTPDTALYRDLQLPALMRLLSRGRRAASEPLGMEGWLCRAFGVERQSDWPVAPLTLIEDGIDAAEKYWLRCDPVHLRTQRDSLVLTCGDALAVTVDEAQALVAALGAHFAADGLNFQARHPQRWYVALTGTPQVVTHELAEVAGREINRFLPGGDDGLQWHQRLNEMQMLLSAHAVNNARESRGQPAINSVWIWGGGVRPSVHSPGIRAVWSDDALARALGSATGSIVHTLPQSANEVLSGGDDEALAILPQLRDAAGCGDLERWRAELEMLEQCWFAPLLAALAEHRLERLTLAIPESQHGRSYELRASDLWKFWRPLRPVADHV